jgi:hypothetical protein
MPIESFQKLWVSCHLLYPNPSQARDIFGLIVETGIDHSSTPYGQIFQGLQKLHRIYRRSDPVKSGSANFEFTSTTMTYWKRVMQKCNKDETFIVMVALLDLISFKDISRVTKIPQTKVRYLFNQSVKKIIASPALRFEQKKEIKLKEYNSQDVTPLFVSEHMIEFVLGLSEAAIVDKMEAKLKDNNRYNDYRGEILKFKAELNDLTTSHHFEEVMKVFGNTNQLESLKKLELKQQKRIFAGLTVLVIIVVGLILRPSFIKAPISDSGDKKVVLEEIAITKQVAHLEPESLNTESLQPSVVTVSSTVTASTPALVKEKIVVAKNTKITPTEKLAVTQQNVGAAKVGDAADEEDIKPVKLVKPTGVYRGVITVTDFEQVTSIMRERIISVGGKKAGEVELGWIKNQNISYFHFIFPAEKREELVDFIQQYGTLKYKFEPHPRVLPMGQSRFIIEVYKGE